ncbi:Six-hairpin glycosidase-like protein [Cladochytrium replicatum]|nr:Six-hairpin glycosidase-like protein [Cladochytrium replicatum]
MAHLPGLHPCDPSCEDDASPTLSDSQSQSLRSSSLDPPYAHLAFEEIHIQNDSEHVNGRKSHSGKQKHLRDGPEEQRLREAEAYEKHWRRWGPYLSERQWATVREDYSANGDVWSYFPFEHAASRVYRWGEDGIGGVCDNHQRLCFSFAFWNEHDPILKERLFGLTGPEGNHGEDVKELYYYLDSTPTHSYMKMLYKYPSSVPFPYDRLRAENASRTRQMPEFEIQDVREIWDASAYHDIFFEYAKVSENDLAVRVRVVNRGESARKLHVLPQLWFRNTWSWKEGAERPKFGAVDGDSTTFEATGTSLPFAMYFHAAPYVETLGACKDLRPETLFTENETNKQKLYGVPNDAAFVKDAFHQRVVSGDKSAVSPEKVGTKCAAWYEIEVPPSGVDQSENAGVVFRFRLCTDAKIEPAAWDKDAFDRIFATRKAEADLFYRNVTAAEIPDDMRNVQRQAFAGLLWSKNCYNMVVKDWLEGDPLQKLRPPPERKHVRNGQWTHLFVDDILSMPDAWEYPFFCAWDTAFHAITLAQVDPWFAKKQLELMTREWYMHPNGQLPAYEWNFSDVNPPVHAWAAWRVYKIEHYAWGVEDRGFLERIFQKLLLNFTWWVNRKDPAGYNVFEGGFLGLDNISPFNRSEFPASLGRLRQADGTGWMAMTCLNMLRIALELAQYNPSYEDIASKFFEHFLYISDAMSFQSDEGDHMRTSLWDTQDGFFYDHLEYPDGRTAPLRVRSLVGLIPLFATMVLEPEKINKLKGFKKRMEWFLDNWDFTKRNVARFEKPGAGVRILLSLVDRERLETILSKVLDETEFLSPYGIRSLSKIHSRDRQPYSYHTPWQTYYVEYLPAESDSGLFGGNSNWRGPIWWSTSFLLIEALQRFHRYFGESVRVACPTDGGPKLNLWEIAQVIMTRMVNMFLRDGKGRRPVNGPYVLLDAPGFKDYVLFYEYFNGDTGAGLGASHQTGWTSLVAMTIHQIALAPKLSPRELEVTL